MALFVVLVGSLRKRLSQTLEIRDELFVGPSPLSRFLSRLLYLGKKYGVLYLPLVLLRRGKGRVRGA